MVSFVTGCARESIHTPLRPYIVFAIQALFSIKRARSENSGSVPVPSIWSARSTHFVLRCIGSLHTILKRFSELFKSDV